MSLTSKNSIARPRGATAVLASAETGFSIVRSLLVFTSYELDTAKLVLLFF